MNTKVQYNVVEAQFCKHSNGVMKIEYDINVGANAAGVFVQVFDFPSPAQLAANTTTPNTGATDVPIKEWSVPAGATNNYKEFKNGELEFKYGLYIVVSTTGEGTLTKGTGNNKFDRVLVELTDVEISGTTEVQISAISTVGTIWADGTSHTLLRMAVTELNNDDSTRYVQLFAKAAVNGDKPIQEFVLPAGATISKDFGDFRTGSNSGFIPYSQDANHTTHNGGYIAISSSAGVLNTDGPANFYIEYI